MVASGWERCCVEKLWGRHSNCWLPGRVGGLHFSCCLERPFPSFVHPAWLDQSPDQSRGIGNKILDNGGSVFAARSRIETATLPSPGGRRSDQVYSLLLAMYGQLWRRLHRGSPALLFPGPRREYWLYCLVGLNSAGRLCLWELVHAEALYQGREALPHGRLCRSERCADIGPENSDE